MPTPGLGTQTPRRSSTRPGINPFTPPIPAPTTDVSNLRACIEALKAAVESLTGQRGDAVNRAVTFRDLANYNLLSPAAAASSGGSPDSSNEKITLVRAIQQQQAQIDELKVRLNALEVK